MVLFQLHYGGEFDRQKTRNCASVAVLWGQQQASFYVKVSVCSLKDYIITLTFKDKNVTLTLGFTVPPSMSPLPVVLFYSVIIMLDIYILDPINM